MRENVAEQFVGPEVGPVIGGFINQFTNWRWSFWVLVIWAGLQWILIFFFVPETYAPVLLRRKAQRLRKETGDARWRSPIEEMDRSVAKTVLWSCIRPFQLLFFEQMVLNLCLLSAILLGILYLFFGVRPAGSTCLFGVQRPQWLMQGNHRPSPSSSKITMVSTNGKPASRFLAFSWAWSWV